MKFLFKINRQYFIVISLLLLFVSIVGYFTLKLILRSEMEEDIYEKEYAIIQELKRNNKNVNIYPIIETKKVKESEIVQKSYRFIYLKDEAENELEPYVEYTNTVRVKGRYYVIKIRHSLLENDALIMAIALPLLLLIFLALIASFLVTKKLNKTLWKDFDSNLRKLNDFSLTNKGKLYLKDTHIEEFDNLNRVLLTLSEKLQSDYEILKQFTQDASHEIQTPLAIILLNLEELLQADLSEQDFKQLHAAINGVKRLSALNKSLILLLKIENSQFSNTQRIIVDELIERKVKEFQPLLVQKNIQLSLVINKDIMTIDIHEELAEMLINNLLSNAIKHNYNGGTIAIKVNKNTIDICNSGAKHALDKETIFHRFTKENSQSYGLGLSIVRQICGLNHLEIEYRQTDIHCFKIKKQKSR